MGWLYGIWRAATVAPRPLVIAAFVFGLLSGGALLSSVQEEFYCNAIQRLMSGGECGIGAFVERWQTLIGSLLAIAAAGIAAVPVFRQLRETARQTSSIGVQTLTRIVESLEQERDEFNEANTKILALISPQRRRSRVSSLPIHPLADERSLQDAYKAAQELRSSLIKHAARNPQADVVSDKRRDLIPKSKELVSSIGRQFRAVRSINKPVSQIRAIIDAYHPNKNTEEYIDAESTIKYWRQTSKAYSGPLYLGGEIEKAWRRIRRLEGKTLPDSAEN